MGKVKGLPNKSIMKHETLIDVLENKVETSPHYTIFQWLQNGEKEGQTLSYKELEQNAKAIASVLQGMNLEGESALLLYPSGLDFISAFFGCLYGKVIAVPAYPPKKNHHMERLIKIIKDSRARVILTTTSIKQKIVDTKAFENNNMINIVATETINDKEAYLWDKPRLCENDVAFLQYTSGSTSAPKGVIVTHKNLIHNINMIRETFDLNQNTNIASWLPFYHDMGLIGCILTSVYSNSKCYLMSPMDFIQEPRKWIDVLSKYKVHFSVAPNFAYDLCVKKIKDTGNKNWDLSAWKYAVSAAEPIKVDTIVSFYQKMKPFGLQKQSLRTGYGLAEATLLVSSSKIGDCLYENVSREGLKNNEVKESGDNIKIVNCGCTTEDQQVIIVNPDTLIKCNENQVGEIWVNGPSVAKGYWNNPQMTSETFEAKHRHDDKNTYLRTGDLGFIKGKSIYYSGRMKDIIIIHGQNFYPQDIESVVNRAHHALQDAVVSAFSITDKEGERLVIISEIHRKYWPVSSLNLEFVIKKHREVINYDEIKSKVRENIAREFDLSLYDFILVKTGTIPKTSSGKIQRNECRAQYESNDLKLWGDYIPNH
ncbi:fatty acyl-AMP ligase [Shouchella patagoniensis]|uniref:fatty acyl-AMP ligase n=1 Tax=Shouchella patagoniensis TaxID=228576 RepID=UPI0009956078|nr:fatty acyl-AMP ligase [Shouchella patagoniensis]